MYRPQIKLVGELCTTNAFRRRSTSDKEHATEIRRIYDNSDMLRFMATRYHQKKLAWMESKRQSMALPDISSSSTREQSTREKEARNRSVCLQEHPHDVGKPLSTLRRNSTVNRTSNKQSLTFIFKSPDVHLQCFLRQAGWLEVRARNNTSFSLKWVSDPSNMDYMYLRPHQRLNHIKNLDSVINLRSLNKCLQHSGFWPQTFDCNRDYDRFCEQFERFALFSLLKKHVSYFTLKQAFGAPRPVSIVDILKHSKFTQAKNPGLLVNVAVLVQACLYYERLLDKAGMSNCQADLDIHLDAKSMQSIVAYSRLNPPYDQYEDFRHSYIQNEGEERTSTKDVKSRLNFSRNYHRYNGDESMNTPSEELMQLLLHYDRLFREHARDYLSSGTNNIWVLMEREQQHRTWQQPSTNNRRLNSHDVLAQKVVERCLALQLNKLLIWRTYVLLSFEQGSYRLYMLGRHYCVSMPNYSECPLLKPNGKESSELLQLEEVQSALKMPQLENAFKSQIAWIVTQTLNLKQLERRKGCFALLTYHTIVDEGQRVWLQDITEGCDIFHKNFSKASLATEIAGQLVYLLFNSNDCAQLNYWKKLSVVRSDSPASNEENHVENSVVRYVQNRIHSENLMRKMAGSLIKTSLLSSFRKCAEWKQNRIKSKAVDLRLGLSLLTRIFRKRLRLLFSRLTD